jgi:hypothetical protein
LKVQRFRRHGHLRRLGARFDHGIERVLLVRGIALDRVDQIGDEIGAALVLIQHLAPCGLGVFLSRRDGVVAAAGKQRQHDGHHQERS